MGSFWVDVYENANDLTAITTADLSENEQTYLASLETIAAVSRFTVPIFKKENWASLKVDATLITKALADENLYGGGALYGTDINYGEFNTKELWYIPIPTTLKQVGQIIDRPAMPSIIWTVGIDFYMDTANSRLVCVRDPTIAGFPAVSSVDEDDVASQTINFWLFNADYDLNYAYEQFGYVLGMAADQSSELYRELLNAFFDTLAKGSTTTAVRAAIGATIGVPIVKETEEIVEVIVDEPRRFQVITDKNVYDYIAGSTAAVSVGDIVRRGDYLTTAVVFIEGDQLQLPQTGLLGIAIRPALLKVDISSSIYFANQDMPTTFSQDGDGHSVVTFPLVANPADELIYWNAVTAAGKASGNSVAKAIRLDTGSGEPLAAAIPPTINPMEFVFNYAFTGNMAIVVVDGAQLTANPDMLSMGRVRRLLPGHVNLLFSTKLTGSGAYDLDTLTSMNDAQVASDLIRAGQIEMPEVQPSDIMAITA